MGGWTGPLLFCNLEPHERMFSAGGARECVH
eukprot:COSAG02_NODE_60377_length_271_cov_0.906977_1_plen_30_part_10